MRRVSRSGVQGLSGLWCVDGVESVSRSCCCEARNKAIGGVRLRSVAWSGRWIVSRDRLTVDRSMGNARNGMLEAVV